MLAIPDRILNTVSPAWRSKKKYEAELDWWKKEIKRLSAWFNGETDWWGIRPPTEFQKVKTSDIWVVNAIMTMHKMRPSYVEELKLETDHFTGQRILEVGCGPLIPSLCFTDCKRYGLDPLIDRYISAGWPLYEYDIKLVNCHAESMPYPDAYFDSVISVNALDHVDDFDQVASEMQRVVKPEGHIYFEVEYHAPTTTEPLELDDNRILKAFSNCDMHVVINRSGSEMFQALIERYNLIPKPINTFSTQRFVTWHGKRS